jgi:multicomponent Na+:H+ antiporter subunit D
MGRLMPVTSAAIVLCGLSLAGVPGTAGFISKWYLVRAALEHDQWWLVMLVVTSSMISLVYTWRFVENAYFRAPRADVAGAGEAPLPLLLPGLLLAAGVVVFGIDTSLTVGSAAQAAALLLPGAR